MDRLSANILVLTMNINNLKKFPNVEQMKAKTNIEKYDVVLFGLQEASFFDVKDFKDIFKEKFKFRNSFSSTGLVSLIFSKTEINIEPKKFIYFGKYFINKGCILVCINNRILWGNIHLSHGENNAGRRMKELSKIRDAVSNQILESKRDVIFLSGDFNFRYKNDEDVNGLEIIHKTLKKNFFEQDIGFPPTYKYNFPNIKQVKNEDQNKGAAPLHNQKMDIFMEIKGYFNIKNMYNIEEYNNNTTDRSTWRPSYCDRIFFAQEYPTIIEYGKYSSTFLKYTDHSLVYIDLHVLLMKEIQVARSISYIPNWIIHIFQPRKYIYNFLIPKITRFLNRIKSSRAS